MNSKTYKFSFLFLLTLVFLLLGSNSILAQWSTNPANNTTICDTLGEQALAKVASTTDGGCYISWFDNRIDGAYKVYLQRLNAQGVKQWSNNGLLISANLQNSSLVDYDLIADHNNNAIITFSDVRNASLNIYVYKITPAGVFSWGPNGVGVSTSTDYQANPRVVETTDGNIVVCWIDALTPYKVAFQKLASVDGAKMWGVNPLLLTGVGTEGLNYPKIVSTDSNCVLVLHTVTTGNFPSQVVKLRANKVGPDGSFKWGNAGVMLQSLGRIAAFSVPKVYSDGLNGAIISWHDDRYSLNQQSGYAQRINSIGVPFYPVNGTELSLMPSRHKFNPVACFDPVSQECYTFWDETDLNQWQHGISGQKLSPTGTRMWGDSAKIFKPLSAPNTFALSSLNALMGSNKAQLFYLYLGAGNTATAEGFATNSSGTMLWPNSYVTFSSGATNKLQMVAASSPDKVTFLAWGETRGSDAGIYAQNINPDGSLGYTVVPVELSSFSANNTFGFVNLNWSTATETNNNRFEVERSFNGASFEKIGFVKGKGTTTSKSFYTFTDKTILHTNASYRLKQVDFDGSFKYSSSVEVTASSIPANFELSQNYPNPFNPSTKISFALPYESIVSLTVFNILGQEVKKLSAGVFGAGNHSVNFDASFLGSGVYICTINAVANNGQKSFNKTIKMLLNK